MKKVILSLVAACAMTTAFAQFNQATLNQIGDNQNALMRQDGEELKAEVYQENGDGTGSNRAETRQVGYNHYINARQSGSYNEAYLEQAQGNTYADAHQVGTANLINSLQSSKGEKNAHASFYQSGTNNQATLDQEEHESDQADTYALFYQYGFRNVASVTQRGNANYANIEQDGADNTAGLSQEGSSNSAFFNQRSDYSVIQGLDGDQATQVGTYNKLEINQTGSFQNAAVSQNGTSNTGLISQSNGYVINF